MLVKPHAHFLHHFSFEFRLVPEYSRSFLTHNYTDNKVLATNRTLDILPDI